MQTDDGVKYAAVSDVTNVSASSRTVGWILNDYSRVYRVSQSDSESYYSREFPVKYVNAAGLYLTSVSQSEVDSQVSGMYLSFNQPVTVLFTAADISQAVVMTQDGYIGWLDLDKLSDEQIDAPEENEFRTVQVTYPDGLNLRKRSLYPIRPYSRNTSLGLIEIIEEGINTPWSLVRVKSETRS